MTDNRACSRYPTHPRPHPRGRPATAAGAASIGPAPHRLLSESITINLGPADDDPDLLDDHQEIATSNAAAVRWWIDPTTGIWPELAEALRVEIVDIDATDETTRRVRTHWSVSVKIIDLHLLRSRTGDSPPPDESFPELWNRTADPFAPLAGLRGATWEPIAVEVTRGR